MPKMKVQSIVNEIMPVLVPLLLKHADRLGCRPVEIENAIKETFRPSAVANDEQILVRPHVLHGVLNELMDDDKTIELGVKQYRLTADVNKFDQMYKSRIIALHTLCNTVIDIIETNTDYFDNNTDEQND